jgi:hypothetical protein
MPHTYVYTFTKIDNEVYRPLLPITIINPINNLHISILALADTGADDCLFPKFIAEQLKYDLKAATAVFSSNQGIGESKVDLWKHPFKIQLLDPTRKTAVWKSKDCLIGCTDHDNVPVLLGFATFLSNFRITFNYQTKKIILECP